MRMPQPFVIASVICILTVVIGGSIAWRAAGENRVDASQLVELRATPLPGAAAVLQPLETEVPTMTLVAVVTATIVPTVLAEPTMLPEPTAIPELIEAEPTIVAAPLPPELGLAPLSPEEVLTLRELVIEAVASMHTGEFEALINYGDGVPTQSEVRFTADSDDDIPRFYIRTIHTSDGETHIFERITIGNRSWQRTHDAGWEYGEAQESAWVQVQQYMPRVNRNLEIEGFRGPDVAVLRWYDPSFDAEVTLFFDPETGELEQQRQVTRSTGVARTINYVGWNNKVEIAPPQEEE